MNNAYFIRRPVVGTAQLKRNEKLMAAKEYARISGYSAVHIKRMCREKKLRAYKNNGHWLIIAGSR